MCKSNYNLEDNELGRLHKMEPTFGVRKRALFFLHLLGKERKAGVATFLKSVLKFMIIIICCAGSSLLRRFFSSCGKRGLLSGRAWASHCGDFSLQSVGSGRGFSNCRCGLWSTGSAAVGHGHAPWHVGSYFLDEGSNPCPLHYKVDS